MKTTRKILSTVVGAAAIAMTGAGLLATSASAAVPLTATTHLTQRPDSGYGGNNWALDNMTRTVTLTGGGVVANSLCATAANPTPTACYAYSGIITDTGTAYATTGAVSPGSQGVPITGSPWAAVTGTATFMFDSSSNAPDATLVPTSLAGSGDPVTQTTTDWAEQFFPAGTSFGPANGSPPGPSLPTWSWTYKDTKDCQQWVDAYNGSKTASGDITGADSCVTSVAAVGNQSVTVGKAASIPVFGSTTSSDKTLTYTTTGLPGGLSLNSSTGLISGTPTATATGGTVTVTAADFAGIQASTSFGITVNPAPAAPAPVVLSGGHVAAISNNRALVAWTAKPSAAAYKVTLIGPNFPGGRTNVIKVTTAFYSGLAAGHNYTVYVTPLNSGGTAAGATGHITFTTTR